MRKALYCAAIGFAFMAGIHAASADMLSAADQRLYRQAFDAAGRGQYDVARGMVAKARDPLLGTVLQWMDYERIGSTATFADLSAFITTHPTWPDIPPLVRRAEQAIDSRVPDATLIQWFGAYPPQTINGVVTYAQALLRANQTAKATDLLRSTWVNSNFDPSQERQYLTAFQQYIRPEDQVARLTRVVWDRDTVTAKRQIALVDANNGEIAEIRLAFQAGSIRAEQQLAALPASLQADPGLIYDHVRYLREAGQTDQAIAILSQLKTDSVRPEAWWTERATLARDELQAGHADIAYQLVSHHGHINNQDRAADATWMTGWIALRFMNDPKTAMEQFSTLYDSVVTPVSEGRAAYWAGRAADAMKKPADAAHWYDLASRQVTSFYGQLAASRLHKVTSASLAADPLPTTADIQAFDHQELVTASKELMEIGATGQAATLLLRAGSLMSTPGERAMVAELATRVGRSDVAVALARRSEHDGMPLLGSGYPILTLPVASKDQAPLILGVIRQESAFHEDAVSPTGARGLMQLMPATAAKLAQTLKLIFKRKGSLDTALTADPGLNIRLGSAYLDGLLSDFNGSYILTAAAYNAGPHRAHEWIQQFGDPRDPKIDPVDWIEQIPYPETRNYVQRVLEGVEIYRQRLGGGPHVVLSLRDTN